MEDQVIIDRVKSEYPGAIVDAAGADCNFEIFVISDAFEGQNLLQRQKAILGLFKEELGNGSLHALSVTAKTPAEQDTATQSQNIHVSFDEIS